MSPSAPRTPGNSSKVDATVRATAQAKIELHLRHQACSTRLRTKLVSPRALARANCSDVACHATSFAVWLSFALIKTWCYAAQRLLNCTRWLGPVYPRSPTALSPMADGAVQDVGRLSVGPPQAQVQVGQGPVQPQRRPESKPSVVRADPASTREVRVIKLEKALEVMGNSQGPAVECFRSE